MGLYVWPHTGTQHPLASTTTPGSPGRSLVKQMQLKFKSHLHAWTSSLALKMV